MPAIQIDFDVFKAITARREHEKMTENDVLRALLGLSLTTRVLPLAERGVEETDKYWMSEGVRFPVGMVLTHTFRGGRTVEATIVETGILVDGKVHGGLSPAGTAVAGYQLNGWRFWGLPNKAGKWVSADSLRG